MSEENLKKIIAELKKDQKFESKDIKPLPLDQLDSFFLRRWFGIRQIEIFAPSLSKANYEGAEYFCLLYKSFTNDEYCYSIFHENFYKKLDYIKNTYWTYTINKDRFERILLISDDPIRLMRYFSNYSNDFKAYQVVCCVPNAVSYGSIKTIKEKYPVARVLTVFEAYDFGDLKKLIVSAVFAEKPFLISHDESQMIFTSGEKVYRAEDAKYSELQKFFRFYSIVKHRTDNRTKSSDKKQINYRKSF